MNARVAAIVIAAVTLTVLAACGEKSQDLVPAENRADKSGNRDSQMRERTLHQGEAHRIGS